MFTKKAQIDQQILCQAKANVAREYGQNYVSAQSVAIEYQRLVNIGKSNIRFDAKCSSMGTAGRK